MKLFRFLFAVLILLCLSMPGCMGSRGIQGRNIQTAVNSLSIVRVNVTRQEYNFHRPWQQGSPVSTTAIGIIIRGSRILVTSEFLANHRYIELEKIDTGKKGGARIDTIDYESNLALLNPTDPKFLENMNPVELTVNAVQGDRLTILQVQNNGNVTPSTGPITSIELVEYPSGNNFLAYRLNNSLQYRLSNSTLPVVIDGKLAGLLMRYDAKAQTVDVVAAPVIEHFLNDSEDGSYKGFPLAGVNFVSAEDPQLRRYIGIPESGDGVYVQRVIKKSGAEQAGLQEGDVILEIGGFPIDSHGNYEHPLYGKVNLSHLNRCHFDVGDKVPFKIFRDGRVFTTEISVEHREADKYLVPPYMIDRPPRFYILGGLVLQELSLPYLLEYGPGWIKKAPARLVNYARNWQSIDAGGRNKIVFISEVLPTSYTVGYESLSNLVIKKINGHVIKDLEDVPLALKTPVKGFHKIELEGPPSIIFLDPEEIPGITFQLKQRYNLPVMQNLE